MKLQKPKGTQDILGKEMQHFAYISDMARATFENYRFQQVETPIFEDYALFSRATGETSDIVTKEMYDFEDKGGRHIALRPEGTASAVRAYVENKLYAPEVQKPVKIWYQGPMFRYERPQSGRLRQFHQIGVESFGAKNPALDAEIIGMAYDFLKVLGLRKVDLVLNSIGDRSSRAAYRKALIDYLAPYQNQLSEDSKRRLSENPLRILDSKDQGDRQILVDAPSILDYLSPESRTYFEDLQSLLGQLKIPFRVDPRMVRGLDYYNDTVFEFVTELEGTELTVCAGGRYDGLVAYFDGPETPAFGFALGVERLAILMEKQGVDAYMEEGLNVYLAVLGEAANQEATKLLFSLRQQSITADRDYLHRKLPAQYKAADKLGAEFVITLGETEIASRQVVVKHQASKKEVSINLDDLYEDFVRLYDSELHENLKGT